MVKDDEVASHRGFHIIEESSVRILFSHACMRNIMHAYMEYNFGGRKLDNSNRTFYNLLFH